MNVNIPLLDIDAQHAPIRGELMRAIEQVIRSGSFILGPEVEKLERRVASYCGTDHAVGVSSGTDALLVSLMALEITPGDEVVTTPFSFFASAGSIARLGARPVFVDIDPVTFNIDPGRIESAITSRTKAILPVHLYGQIAEMGPVLEIAERYSIRVIEDAAQAIGAEYRDGRRAGSMGDVGCFSFYPSKNLGALGDAGMVVTNDPELAERIRVLRAHGARPKYHHHVIGGNFRLDAFQAAVLNVKLDYLDGWTKKRQENAKRYVALFRMIDPGGAFQLGLPEAVYELEGLEHYHIYNQFVIRAWNRDRLREHLGGNGVATEVYYPVPLHLQRCFEDLGYRTGDLPEAEQAAEEVLALPVYAEMTEEQQKSVVDLIKGFYAG
jgi:dTDP-4-amino-4,6-dideoxygalactose transaminase